MEVQTLVVSEQQLSDLTDGGTISFTTSDGTTIPILDRDAYAIATGEANPLEAASPFGMSTTTTATHADLPIGTITLNVAEMLADAEGGSELLKSAQEVRFIAHQLDSSILMPSFGVACSEAAAGPETPDEVLQVIPECDDTGTHEQLHNSGQDLTGMDFELSAVASLESTTQELNLVSTENPTKQQNVDSVCGDVVNGAVLQNGELPSQEEKQQPEAAGLDPTMDMDSLLMEETNTNTVVIDVSNPIQLCQNSLISVNGQKCVLQQNSETGELIAYPVKEPEKPRKRRGRPRKTREEATDVDTAPAIIGDQADATSTRADTSLYEEQVLERGLVETANEVGAIVKRSSRKRKKTRLLSEYETGKLKFDGSDDDDVAEENATEDDKLGKCGRCAKSRKPKLHTKLVSSSSSSFPAVKRGRGRPRRYGIKPPDPPPTQSFLIQTVDGQAIMVHVPMSNIPPGVSIQSVAQRIAESLNANSIERSDFLFPVATKPLDEATPIPIPEDTVPDGISNAAGSATDVSITSVLNLNANSEGGTTVAQPLPMAEPVEHASGMSETKDEVDGNTTEVDTFTQCEIVLDDTRQSLPPAPVTDILDDVVTKAVAAITASDFGDPGARDDKQDGAKDKETPSVTPSTVIPISQNVLSLLMPSKEADAPVKIGIKAPEDDLDKLHCPKCDYQAFYAKQYQEHLSTHEEDVYRCKCCTYLSLTEDDLVHHYKETHPKCICSICNHRSEHPYVMKRHMCKHSDTGLTCEVCGKTYKDHYILRMHIRMVHMPAEVLFECSICNKKFTRKAHLKRHLRTHDPDKPFKCPLCDYRGCERSDITKHRLIHEEPKHMCEVCGKSFRHIKNKELHVKRHRGQRDYKCGVCNFYGYTFTDIRKHIERKHTDAKVIVCDKCGQAFKTHQLLSDHQGNGQCELFRLEEVLQEPDSSGETTHLDENQMTTSDDQMISESDQLVSSNQDADGIASITLADESIAPLNALGGQSGSIMVSSSDVEDASAASQHILETDRQVTILDGILDPSGTSRVTLVTDQSQIGSEPLTIVTDSRGSKQVAMLTSGGHVISGVIMDASELSSFMEADQQVTELDIPES